MWIALALIQAASAPLPAGVEDDLTCLAIIAATANKAPPQEQSGLQGGFMYFMGRIDHAAPGFDYPAHLVRLIDDAEGNTKIQAARPRCVAKLREISGSLAKWGEHLQKRNQK